jgi:ParB family transcriptional regulator, chromosome partitioning protein
MAMSNMTEIVQGAEDNLTIYEAHMQHRNALNTQIDLLIKQKKKVICIELLDANLIIA